jgi:putative transposase
MLEEMLKAELDNHLGYEYGEKPLGLNTRKGYSTKTVKSSGGEIDIKVLETEMGALNHRL